jgi:hypothetical protein
MVQLTKIELGESMAQCPNYWYNFIRHLQEKYHSNYSRDISIPILMRELKVYGAGYHLSGSSTRDYVEFNDPAQLILFAMRWT